MMSLEATYTTSQLARAADVGSQTLRYYERRGLLPEPPRTAGGHRLYGQAHLERLQFIQKVQQLGFALEEIQELIAHEEGTTELAPATVERFMSRIDEKAVALSEMRETLQALQGRGERVED